MLGCESPAAILFAISVNDSSPKGKRTQSRGHVGFRLGFLGATLPDLACANLLECHRIANGENGFPALDFANSTVLAEEYFE